MNDYFVNLVVSYTEVDHDKDHEIVGGKGEKCPISNAQYPMIKGISFAGSVQECARYYEAFGGEQLFSDL